MANPMETPTGAMLRVCCLGDFTLTVAGAAPIKLSPQASEFLFLLILERGKPVSRTDLCRHIWQTVEVTSSNLTTLRQYISKLRKLLGEQVWRLAGDDEIAFLLDKDVTVDVYRLREAMETAASLDTIDAYRSAMALYSAPLLPNSKIKPIVAERQRLLKLYLDAHERLAEKLDATQQRDEALSLLNNVVSYDPLRETAIGMLLHLLENNLPRASSVIDKYRSALNNAPRRIPNESLFTQFEQIRARHEALRRRALGQDAEIQIVPLNRISRLPVPQHPMIGREAELHAALVGLARRRYVMLHGPVGVGKTRIALEIGALRSEHYRDGVLFVDLSALPRNADQMRIAQEIVTALPLTAQESNGDLTGTLERFLANRHLLLLLDHCEHINVHCASLVRLLLERCPNLAIVTTTAVDFSDQAGRRVSIRPLPLPEERVGRTMEDIRCSPAVRMFEAMLNEQYPEIVLSEEHVEAIVTICNSTEGLPQAILQQVGAIGSRTIYELAQDLRHGLVDPFYNTDAAPSESSRAIDRTIAANFGLCTPIEQTFLMRASIMAGTWDREAALAIITMEGQPEDEMHRCLDRLCRQSLLERQEVEGQSRFHLLKNVRCYAASLANSAAIDDAQRRRAKYYTERIEQICGQTGQDQQNGLRRLALDQVNIEAALEHCLRAKQIEETLHLAIALARYWYTRGQHALGRSWYKRLLTFSEQASPQLRQSVLHTAAKFAHTRSDYTLAKDFWGRCLEIADQIGDERGVARAHSNLGMVAIFEKRYDEAEELICTAMNWFSRHGEEKHVAILLANLGQLEAGRGNIDAAIPLYDKSQTMFKQFGLQYDYILGLNNMTGALLSHGRLSHAASKLSEIVDLVEADGNERHLAHCLTNFIILAARDEDLPFLALMLGAHDTLREKCESPVRLENQIDIEEIREKAEDFLGPSAFAARFNAAARMVITPDIYRALREYLARRA